LFNLHPPDDRPVGHIVRVAYEWPEGKARVQLSANARLHRLQHTFADRSRPDAEGEIPPALEGAFYRVQPDPQFPPSRGDDRGTE
jgi:hypothetical protein